MSTQTQIDNITALFLTKPEHTPKTLTERQHTQLHYTIGVLRCIGQIHPRHTNLQHETWSSCTLIVSDAGFLLANRYAFTGHVNPSVTPTPPPFRVSTRATAGGPLTDPLFGSRSNPEIPRRTRQIPHILHHMKFPQEPHNQRNWQQIHQYT